MQPNDNVQLLEELNRNVNIIEGNYREELPTLNNNPVQNQPNQQIIKENFNNITNEPSQSLFSKNNLKLLFLSLLLFFLLSIDSFNQFLLQYMNSFLSILLRGIVYCLTLVLLNYII
jgi:uncharacterized membrane protein